MKKHLIAAAVAAAVAAPAMAQNVEIYGIMGLGYSSVKTDWADASTKTTTTGAAGQQAGTRIGFRGTEDLGGGLKAGFVYEIAVSNNNSTSVFGNTRLAYVDLAGGFGTFRAGKVDSITRQIYNGFTAHGNTVFQPGNVLGGSFNTTAANGIFGLVPAQGTAIIAAINASTLSNGDKADAINGLRSITSTLFLNNVGAGGTRVNDSIGYISPAFNGFRAQVQYGQTKVNTENYGNTFAAVRTETETKDRSVNVGITYAAGPLSIAIGQDRVTSEATTDAVDNKFKTNMLGATYDFGVAKVFGLVTRKTLDMDVTSGTAPTAANLVATGYRFDDSVKVKDNTVGVTVPVGATLLVASFTDGEIGSIDYSGYQLQANYALSKRTKAYAMYGQTKVKDLFGEDLKQKGMTIGLQHNF
jgi:predicted porin